MMKKAQGSNRGENLQKCLGQPFEYFQERFFCSVMEMVQVKMLHTFT